MNEEAGSGVETSVWSLFSESFDVFSVILLIGSMIAVTLIIRLVLDARRSVIAPDEIVENLETLLEKKDTASFLSKAQSDDGIVASACVAAHGARKSGSAAMREAAEIGASNACGRWTRPLDLIRVIGEIGPLIGLAGTVWGMILAFVRLGQAGGTAGPTDLSMGISKALFHTLLGLMLAVPCLLIYGWYRSVIEKHCNTAFEQAGGLVDQLAVIESAQSTDKPISDKNK
ncbi:MAG: MotA/TolQ/ExbB proton channel family protein [Phycisphaerales bacterium]